MSKIGKNVHDESVKKKYSSGQKCTDEDTGLKKKEGILINNIKATKGKTEKSLTKKKGKTYFSQFCTFVLVSGRVRTLLFGQVFKDSQ